MTLVTSYGVGRYRVNEASVLFTPRISSEPKRAGVIHCHGAAIGDPVPLDVTLQYLNTFRDEPYSLARYGITSLAADLGGGETYGNATADAGMNDALTFLKANGANDTPVGLLGGSMGGAVAANWTRTHLASVACIAMLIPALDLEDIRSNNRGGFASSIESAYGGNTAWQATRLTRNPVEFAAALASIPIAIWYSTNDDVCLPARINAFADSHGNTELFSIGAVGHTAFVADGMEIANWMNQHLN